MNTTQCENGKNPRIEMKKVLKVVAGIVAALVLLLGYGVYLSLTKELNGDLVLVGFKEVEWDEKLNG